MDRYEELEAKRRNDGGLTHEEAMELGRLDAERAGKPYEGNAEDPPTEVRAARLGMDPEETTEAEVRAKERDVDDTVMSDERRKAAEVDTPPPA